MVLKVLLVRHAQSENNIVQASVHVKMREGVLTPQESQAEWLALRREDPGLSPDGLQQTVKLGKHIASSDIAHDVKRACQTANAIASSIKGCKFEVLPNLFEVGGIYRAQKAGNGSEYVKVPGHGMTKEEFKKEFPHIDTSRLPDSGSWDGGKGYESTSESIKRAEEVASWLRSRELHAELGADGEVVLVSHADFLALLLANLHRDTVVPQRSDSSPDLDVSYHGVSEQQLQAGMQRTDDYAHCVYSKYKVSLASCSLLEIADDGSVLVHCMNDKSYLTKSKRCSVQ